MQDKSLHNSRQSQGISEGLQNFIDSMVEEIVLEGKPFDTQKKYLKKFGENEGLDYEQLESNLYTFIDIIENIKITPNKLMEKFAMEKAHDAYISDDTVSNLLSCIPSNLRFRIFDGITGKYGFINKEGKKVVEPHFDKVTEFLDGWALVYNYGKHGTIDYTGKEIVPAIYDDIIGFRDGMAAVLSNGKWGFVNKQGRIVIPCKYDSIGGWAFRSDGGFFEGLAVVGIRNKRGYVDKNGKMVIPCKYDYASSFSEGLAIVRLENQLLAINRLGETVLEIDYDDYSESQEGYSEGLLGVALYTEESDTKWGFIDKEGKEVVPCIYEQIEDFCEGFAAVVKDGKWGFINKNGIIIIECTYDYVANFSEGLALVRKDIGGNWKTGFVNYLGDLVIPCLYDDAENFNEGLAAVEKDGKWGFVDKNGELVIQCKYDRYSRPTFNSLMHSTGSEGRSLSFENGLAMVSINGKTAYIDKNEQIIWSEDNPYGCTDLFVFVIASNASMNELHPLLISKFRKIEEDVKDVIRRFRDVRNWNNSRLAIINYAGRSEIQMYPTPFYCIDDVSFSLRQPFKEAKALVAEGLKAALDLASKNVFKKATFLPICHVVLISDGSDDSPEKTKELLDDIRRDWEWGETTELCSYFVGTLVGNKESENKFHQALGGKRLKGDLYDGLLEWVDRDVECMGLL